MSRHDTSQVGPTSAATRPMGRRALLAGIPVAATTALASTAVLAPAASADTPPAGTPETTLAELRALTAAPSADLYLVTDPGQEGLFRYDSADHTTADNTGTVVASAGGARFKRVYDGPLNVRWFGATGDGDTDDAAAIQAAMDVAQQRFNPVAASLRLAVYLPAGYYRISAPIAIDSPTQGIRIFGDGMWQSAIAPHDSVTAMEAIFRFSDTTNANRFEFDHLFITGHGTNPASSVQYGIYAPRLTRSHIRDVTFRSFSEAGIGIGAGWINTIERCEIPGCTDGIRSIDHHINMLNIIDCDINTCANAAINITHTGENIRISGCTIEGNPGTAIIVQSQVQNLEIVGNYFEANATAGAQFTAPNQTLHAYVILNGYGTPGTATTNQPPGAIRVADNFVAMQAVPEPAYFVAAFACYGGLDIINNTINDKDTAAHAKVDTLLLTGTSATGLGARVDNVHMRGNGKSWDPLQSTAALHAITVLDLAGGNQHIA